MSSNLSLIDRHIDATQKLILSTAVEVLERSGFNSLSVRAVAKKAGISERTVFRYFASRDEFLDAVSDEATNRIHAPAPPTTIEELLIFPEPLYTSYEGRASLLKALLHTEIFKRVRATVAQSRWQAIADLIDKHTRHLPKHERALAATNINYYLSATTWLYYRFEFELSLEDSINAAKLAVRSMVDEVIKK
jgi:AcrR family transcriptional regulator